MVARKSDMRSEKAVSIDLITRSVSHSINQAWWVASLLGVNQY